MKSLFDRTKVYVRLDAPELSMEEADGVVIRLRADTTPADGDCGYDSFDALCRALAPQKTDIVAEIPALDAEQIKLFANCAIRHEMWDRILFVSSAHKTLDTFPRGTVRFSLGFASTEGDVDAALAAIRTISEG